ncbi:MAG: ubiquinone/menaquinone biosynthesis C-methylase UbiE [Colwellia sp.]|jgi:ubiquinone/menaquinone biosynthesis C-methylase UbiE
MSKDKSYKRTEVYQQQRIEPKHLFVTIGNIIDNEESDKKPFDKNDNFLDVGGAAGDLSAYLKQRFSYQNQHCIEYDKELVCLASKNYPKIKSQEGNAEKLPIIWNQKFLIVTMVGVMSIFDDFKPSLSECIRVTKAGGKLIIIGHFNDFPVDALIHWKYSNNECDWNKGYNLFSVLSVSTYLEKHDNIEQFSFSPFMVPFDLLPQDDPIRTWTEKSITGDKIFRNGIMPINLKILQIKLK